MSLAFLASVVLEPASVAQVPHILRLPILVVGVHSFPVAHVVPAPVDIALVVAVAAPADSPS